MSDSKIFDQDWEEGIDLAAGGEQGVPEVPVVEFLRLVIQKSEMSRMERFLCLTQIQRLSIARK